MAKKTKGTKSPGKGTNTRKRAPSSRSGSVVLIGDVMRPDPVCLDSSASLEEAALVMEEYGVRHLPVEEDLKIVGVVSDRDIIHGKAFGSASQTTVADVMAFDPFTVTPETELSVALEIMAANRLGCVLIKERGKKITGIFTTTDAVKILAILTANK